MKRFLLLGSRIALGVYVPAVSIKKQLESAGDSADLVCLEDLYSGRDEMIEETKKSFHKDFRLAKMSYRLPTRNGRAVDPEKSENFIRKAAQVKYDAVIVFSGFWVSIMNDILEASDHYKGRIYAVHMDVDYSLSWKGSDHSNIKDIWLYNLEQGKVCSVLEKPDMNLAGDSSDPTNASSEKWILVHGGGWGIGDYSPKIIKLNEMGYKLDIIIYYPDELDTDDTLNNYYLLDPEWKPAENSHEYPRILVYRDGSWVPFIDNDQDVNPLRILINRTSAILSKPGGGTLSDSLITATPLIFGEELAKYERDNKNMWIDKGFAVDFTDFIDSEDTDKMLSDLKNNLIAARNGLPHVLDLIDTGAEI